MHVLIVGGGLQGLALAWVLDGRGHDVTVFEAGGLPGQGPSLAFTRSLHALLPHASRGVQRLAALAPAVWPPFLEAAGGGLSKPTGAVAIDRGGGALAALADRIGDTADLVRLDAAGLAERGAALALPPGAEALYQPSAQLLRAGLICERLGHAMGRGRVRMRARTPVTAVQAAPPAVTLSPKRGLTNREVYGDCVVVAAGAGQGSLVAGAGGAAPIEAPRLVLEATPPEDAVAAWAAQPVMTDPEGDGQPYWRPPIPDGPAADPGLAKAAPMTLGLGASAHGVPPAGEPPDKDAARTIADQGLALSSLAARPNLDNAELCSYLGDSAAPTPPGPLVDGLWQLAALGEAGFRLAPVMALAVADALEGHYGARDLAALVADDRAQLPPAMAPYEA